VKTLPPTPVLRRAFARKDASFDGVFVVAVKTTGIFCRPVCRARTPRPEHVEFFGTAQEALHAGYRACRRCRPLGHRAPPVVTRLMDTIERDPATRLHERDLAGLGIDASTARRAFRRWCGMTFQQYQRARRMGAAMAGIRRGGRVIQAQVESGYGSGSGFRAAFARVFGAPPSEASARPLAATWIETPLGPMLAIAGDDGLCLLDFVDRRGVENAVLRLRRRLRAAVLPGTNAHLDQLRHELDEYFAGRRRSFDVALVEQSGTPFQRRAWDYLRTIPRGETRTYAEEAAAVGSRRAVRAVGSANGMNYLAIVVPCHRVIASNGELTGYGGGLARKRWLLEHESRASTP